VSNIASYTVSYPFSDITEVIKTIGFEGGSNPRLIGGEVERTFWRLVYNDACEIRCTALQLIALYASHPASHPSSHPAPIPLHTHPASSQATELFASRKHCSFETL